MHRQIFQKSIAAIAAGAIAATSFAVLPSFSASAATTIYLRIFPMVLPAGQPIRQAAEAARWA